MPDPAQAPVVDTPVDPAGSLTGTPGSEAEVNWQERYANLQPEYTRATQAAASLQSLVEAARNGDPDAISQLGFEIADDDDEQLLDDTPDDPSAALVARLAVLEQAEQARAQQSQEQQLLAQAERHIDAELGKIEGLATTDQAWVIDRALRLPPTAAGLPDIATANAEFQAWDTARQTQQAEAARTRRRQPPAIRNGGQEGTDAPDFSKMSRSDIDVWMTERARAASE